MTADRIDAPDRLGELERAYATARALSTDLPIVATSPAISGDLCREVEGFAVSVTPWTDGARSGHGDLDAGSATRTATFLAALHTTPAPTMVAEWNPQYASHRVLDDLGEVVRTAWESGPFAADARELVAAHLEPVARWRRRYARLVERALGRRDAWVVTHGEPGPHNQIHTADGVCWVDWESVRLAPRERDLSDLAAHDGEWRGAYPHRIDPDMLEMFDLAWRLDEIGQYTQWFRQPHTGSEDDRIALGGLREDLTRPDRRRAVEAGDGRP